MRAKHDPHIQHASPTHLSNPIHSPDKIRHSSICADCSTRVKQSFHIGVFHHIFHLFFIFQEVKEYAEESRFFKEIMTYRSYILSISFPF